MKKFGVLDIIFLIMVGICLLSYVMGRGTPISITGAMLGLGIVIFLFTHFRERRRRNFRP
jgi:hypothetical protein